MSTTVVLGSQFGDEGKGKLVDLLSEKFKITARSAGGHNAGHTIVVNGITYDFHILPSGLVNPETVNLVGSGTVVSVPQFFHELQQLEKHTSNTRTASSSVTALTPFSSSTRSSMDSRRLSSAEAPSAPPRRASARATRPRPLALVSESARSLTKSSWTRS